MKKRVLVVLGILTLLVPLGLLSESPAWGEWEKGYYEKILGFIPQGIREAKSINALLPDYSLLGVGETLSYYISAFVGICLIYLILFLISKKGKDATSL